MELTKAAWGLIVGLPSLIIVVALAAFPEWAVYFLVALVVLWVVAIVAYLGLGNLKLQTEVQTLTKALEEAKDKVEPEPKLPAPTATGSAWKLLEEIDLLLDGGWQPTRKFHLSADDTIRVTATGKNRFILHLVTNLRRRLYDSLEATAETMSVTRLFDVASEGDYAVVVSPVGDAPFHVKVRVERELKPTVIGSNW